MAVVVIVVMAGFGIGFDKMFGTRELISGHLDIAVL
jgi:hypothetical protein